MRVNKYCCFFLFFFISSTIVIGHGDQPEGHHEQAVSESVSISPIEYINRGNWFTAIIVAIIWVLLIYFSYFLLKKMFLITGFIAVVAIIFIGIFMFTSNENVSDINILDINLRDHENLALHIHPLLQIEVLGLNYTIPPIGVTDEGMRVIHTHDTSGKLHIESPYPHQFHLEDWFSIWGETFNSSCIIEYCVDKDHTLKMFVNGRVNNQFGDLEFKDGDTIKIVYANE